jgi:iduronate 2-sulfatase
MRPLLALVSLFLGPVATMGGAERPNILFFTVDDLRPDLGCYDRPVHTPHIDRLASRGVVFTRAYCQQALCNPSRASFMTGLRPDSTGVHDLVTHFRRKVPSVTTLPQHFRSSGYHAQAIGKIYHPAFRGFGIGSDLGDPPSWSEPAWLGGPRYYYSPMGVRLAQQAYRDALRRGPVGAPNWVAEAIALQSARAASGNPEPAEDDWTRVNVRVLATEAPEVPDAVLYDGQVAERAIAALNAYADPASDRTPFFLAVGFLKPHLPFVAPRKYWERYDADTIDVAANPDPPEGAPRVALAIPMDELRDTYPKDSNFTSASRGGNAPTETYDLPKQGALSTAQQRQLRHGYYACVSFIDEQIGRILDELQRLGMDQSTIVVVLGDHGFSLGEHGLWGKLTNFEVATRVPLIISMPGRAGNGGRSDGLVELVDVYPTLCEAAGLSRPTHLEGSSFDYLLDAPRKPGKAAVFSQHPRPGVMGYSVRTDRYRLTRWKSTSGEGPDEELELYDHWHDAAESVNLARRPEMIAIVGELSQLLERRTDRADEELSAPAGTATGRSPDVPQP